MLNFPFTWDCRQQGIKASLNAKTARHIEDRSSMLSILMR